MRLTFKLVLWFLVSVVAVVGVNGYLAVRSEVVRYQHEMSEHHTVMGRVLREAFRERLLSDGEAKAVAMLDYTDQHTRAVDIRWVSVADDPAMNVPHAPRSALASLTSDGEVHYFDSEHEKLQSYVSVDLPERKPSALEFSESYDGVGTVIRNAIVREIRTVAGIAVAAGVAAALFGIGFVGRPVQSLVAHARRVGKGDFTSRTTVSGSSELGELAREMNVMCEQLVEAQETKLKTLEQLRHAERLNTVGKLASGLAHELGTPLNVIILRANAIAAGKAAGDQAMESARSIAEQATRMTELVKQLLEFARRRAPERRAVSLEALVAKTTDFLHTAFAKANVRVETEKGSMADTVTGDAGQLQQVLTNVFMNAVHAMPAGGVVHVDIDDVHATPPADRGLSARDFLRVRIKDEGTGIEGELLSHIFEPFFTTKEVGDGTGLGLSVCYGIVRDHNGWLEAESEVGRGTTISIFLPKEAA
jgi:signal transduction histidine kinase